MKGLHENIVMGISQGICLVDPASENIVFANPFFEKLTGYGQREILGMPLTQLHLTVVLRRGLERIEITVERIAKIIRGLRAFAREEEGAPFLEIELKEILSDTLSLCAERLKRHCIQLRVTPVPADIIIECRHIQISQILLNLLNNAFDAVEPLAEKWISVEVRDLDSSVEVAVTDSGIGIPKCIRDRMMDPFFTTKTGFKGSGLGLSISKGLAESHHGALSYVESDPHTRFVLTLPKKYVN